eukprot:1058309-Alexandrium_andersonii.AAC.1
MEINLVPKEPGGRSDNSEVINPNRNRAIQAKGQDEASNLGTGGADSDARNGGPVRAGVLLGLGVNE